MPLEGVFQVTFAIYDEATGGTALNGWVETHENVSVIAGQINVLLGSITSLDDPDANGSMDDAISFEDDLTRYLGIKVGAETNQEMVPRHQLVPSFHARVADTTVADSIDTEQLVDSAVTFEKLDTPVFEAVTAVAVPPGSILPYGGRTAPEGWVLCDGAVYDGTLPEFAALFDAIGTAFGGSGNMFQVPDLRGQFLRGLDAGAGVDPDFASRTGGEGESRIGSTQGSAIVALSGSALQGGQHGHSIASPQERSCPPGQNCTFSAPTGGSQSLLLGFWPLSDPNTFSSAGYVAQGGAHSHTVTVSPTSGTTSTETRPTNVAVNYICKL